MTKHIRRGSRRVALPVFLLLLLASLAAAGCTKAPDDAAIKNQIQSRFYADQGLKATNLQVVVTKGQVMLTGQVPSAELKDRAVQIAGAAPGVKLIEDRITLASTAPTTAAAEPTTAAPKPTEQPPKRRARRVREAPPAPAPQPAVLEPMPTQTAEQQTAPPPEPVPMPEPPPQQQPAPEPVSITIPAGTHLMVRMIDAVDSSKDKVGTLFRSALDSPVVVGGQEVVPAGANVSVRLATAKTAGRMTGTSELELQLVKMTTQGRTYPLVSNAYTAKGKSRGEDTAKKVGVGAAIGAVIGAIAGGGKGAAIGAATGAGAGTAIQLATRGQQVKVPSETLLDFELQKAVTVTASPTQP
jgi:outer membrane biosynthesis protein TonB